jgi:hypothetical protein
MNWRNGEVPRAGIDRASAKFLVGCLGVAKKLEGSF